MLPGHFTLLIPSWPAPPESCREAGAGLESASTSSSPLLQMLAHHCPSTRKENERLFPLPTAKSLIESECAKPNCLPLFPGTRVSSCPALQLSPDECCSCALPAKSCSRGTTWGGRKLKNIPHLGNMLDLTVK